MLVEIKEGKQYPGEGFRRWFHDQNFDLYSWSTGDGAIQRFELCYKKGKKEYSFSWSEAQGYSHSLIDDGENEPLQYKSVPIWTEDGQFDGTTIAQQLWTAGQTIDPGILQFVYEKIRGLK